MDGIDGNEGVGSNAGRKGTRICDFLRLGMLMSDASCSPEVEAPLTVEIQMVLAAAMSTRGILINKQRKRQYRSGRVHALLR